MKRPSLPRNHIQPTSAQIDSNIIVVPRYIINENRNVLRWFHSFDVEVDGVRTVGRHLDSENRVGGISLKGNVKSGAVLRVTFGDDNTLRLTTVGGDWPDRI